MNYLLESVKSSISLHTKIKHTSSIYLRQSRAFTASCTNVQLKSPQLSPMKTFIRSLGHFFIHPERMKQLMKAKDAHAICNYIASEKYKKKLQDMVERQKKEVFEFSEGVPSKEIKFQHIINCAQPNPILKKKSNDVHDDEEEEEVCLPVIPKKQKKIMKTTIMSVMLKKKQQEERDIYWKHPNRDSSETEKNKKIPSKKSNINKRSTILPIILKKMQERTIKHKLENNARNTYKQIQNETESIREDLYEEDTFVDTSHSKSNFKGQKGVRNLSTSAVQEDTLSEQECELKKNEEFECDGAGLIDSGILPDKSKEMHEIFTRDPEKSRKSRKKSSPASVMNAKKTSKSLHGRIKNKYLRRRPRIKIRRQVFLSPNSEVNLPVNGSFHVDKNLCNAIETSHLSQESNPICEGLSLYDRVKRGNT